VEAIHGNRTQEERMEALNLFKSGQIRILIATDVAARGIDVTGITHVINYDTPLSPEEYIHRIGRTGRAEFEGAAITFVSDEEYKQWVRIKDKIKATFELESTSFASRPAPQGQQVRQHGQAPHRAGSGGRPRQQQHGRRHGRQR
jgi:ATP-dependent RNA helicase RhlE